MNLKYNIKNTKGFCEVNFYAEEGQKKMDSKDKKFLNFKIPENLNNRRKFISFVRSIIQNAQSNKIKKITFDYNLVKNIKIDGVDEYWKAKLFVENIILAEYKFDKYKTKKEDKIEEFSISGNFSVEEKNAFKEAEIVANAMNIARDLSNTPGGEMTPSILVNDIKNIFKNDKSVKIKVLEEKDAKNLNMNLFLAVGQGSKEKSKFIIAEYSGGKKNEKPIVLVGKGVTFDTGGLNLKSTEGIFGMNMDMTGGAVVALTLKAISDLKIKKNIVVLIPAVENSPSGESYRPGDIIKSMSGKTVEIKNTDAEGRLILADTLTFSKRYNPSILIDVATLTGASLVAVGQKASVVLGKDTIFNRMLADIGEQTGDYIWELPLWDEYEKDIEGVFADIMNTAKTKQGGTITGGMFLWQFVKDLGDNIKWAHIDIAPRMESIDDGDNLCKGATGEPLRMLVEFIKSYK